MHLIIVMLVVVAAALLGARMLANEPGAARYVGWALYGIAGAGLALMVLTIVAALLE